METLGTRETILLKGAFTGKQEEAISAEVLYPGQFVELNANGELVKAAGNSTVLRVVVENDLIGKGIRDEYDAGEQVRYIVLCPGDVINARVPAGAAAAFVVAAPVSIAVATGFAVAGTALTIGDVREALDNSAGTQEEFVVTTIGN